MKYIKPILLPLFIFLLWEAGTYFKFFNQYLIASPSAVFAYLVSAVGDGSLFVNLFVSCRRIFMGFILSFIIAAPLGVLYGAFKPIRSYVYPSFEFVRHIPPLALLSILILLFGISEMSKIALIVIAAFFPIFMNCSQAISGVDAKLIEAGRSFKFSRFKIFIRIILPCAFPVIFTGMQLSMGYSFRALIGAEMLAAASGMGFLIRNAESFMRSDIVFAGIIVLGIMGLIIDFLFMGAAKIIRIYYPLNFGFSAQK
jgi:sulfonate transport system permease protein